jgi:hypothetical protein
LATKKARRRDGPWQGLKYRKGTATIWNPRRRRPRNWARMLSGACVPVKSIEEGLPYPLGAHWDGKGTNFALFSASATKVEICMFEASTN